MWLEFRTDIPHGNGCLLGINYDKSTLYVDFSPEPRGGPEALWFCFRLERAGPKETPGEKVVIGLRHFVNLLGGSDPARVRPVIRSNGGDWERLPAGTLQTSPDGQVEAVWVIGYPSRYVDVALCYPYGAGEVDSLALETGGFWRAEPIGVSQGGRPLTRLSNDFGAIGDGRPGLLLIARQHSGETPGSWVLDGLLRRMAAAEYRGAVVWVYPLANIDGVEEGEFGKDGHPCDFNRSWSRPPMRHEALAIQRDLTRWRSRCQPALALDFHAPTACETEGVFAYLPNKSRRPEVNRESRLWAERFEAGLTSRFAAPAFSKLANYPSRYPTPSFTDYCAGHEGIPSLTIETPYTMCGRKLMTREAYREAGAALAETLMQRL